MKKNKIPVVYIVGRGRSGSTLLENLIGESNELFPVGEFRLWHKCFNEKYTCGCGASNKNCKFWSEVFSIYSEETIENYRNLFLSIMGYKKQFFLKKDDNQKELLIAIAELYRRIHEVSGGKVIVDASKNPYFGYLLSQIEEIDLKVLHIIRDPRAVTFSWIRQLERADREEHELYRQKMSTTKSAMLWNASNYLSESFKGKISREQVFTLKYEEMTNDLETSLQKVFNHIGMDFPGVPKIIREKHSISGNPSRLKSAGEIKIRKDQDWIKGLKTADYLLSSILTFPFLVYYKYKVQR